MTLGKTRIIPISDFYTRLQLEYISYKFRSLIYQRAFDKKKFNDICNHKKKKIDQISLENCLPSIFNNQDRQKKYLQKFFGDGGFPNFTYRDDYQSKVKGYWDQYHYFIEGASVKFFYEGECEIGRIMDSNVKDKKVTVTFEDKTILLDFSEVTRIFPSDFFENLFK